MTDLSHWDFAEQFKAKEAAELIMGILPEQNTQVFGVMGEEYLFVAKITPVLRRMELAYKGACSTLSAAATWGEEAAVSLDRFPMKSEELHSELMGRIRTDRSTFSLNLFGFDKEPGSFDQVYFSRGEIDRWLNAIGMKSIYQFTKEPNQNSEHEISYPSVTIKGKKPHDVFDRNKGDLGEAIHQWLILDTWPYEAAMFLIAGVIPELIYGVSFGYFKIEGGLLSSHNGEKDYKADQIDNLKRLWLSNPDHPDRAAPQVFLSWAESKNIDIYWLEGARVCGYLKLPDNKIQSKPSAARWPWGSHHTELLGHLDAAAQRYWGERYDPTDLTTAPTNVTVSEWLQTARKVSKTMADSIASMLRPDGLPTGPRK